MSRRHIVIEGRVQGVGFRPFVYRLAHGHGLVGWVLNGAGRVEVEVEGPGDACAAFEHDVIAAAPPLARPRLVSSEPIPTNGAAQSFEIRPSSDSGKPRIHVPPDHFACDDCLEEFRDPAARRHAYPFINCTQCGPRYTLIRAMPYDRPNTTMADFPLCPDCAAEYGDPLDRRFHAQPLACPVCGPTVRWRMDDESPLTGSDALERVVAGLHKGLVVAMRGIGGYHLVCDARNEEAVARLRERKRRPHKPLALMVPERGEDHLDAVREIACPTPAQAAALAGPERPIVLVDLRREAGILADGIAPGLDEIGIMLPYSPLHHRVLGRFGDPIIATSGNVSGEPVITDCEEAESHLAGIADAFLHHDRPICRPADDPVLREISGRVRPIRHGRGTAPLEAKLPVPLKRPTLAVGAFLKNTVALGFDDRVVVSPHIGDLDTVRGRRIFERVAEDLQALYDVDAVALACDAHPDYPNARWARSRGLPVLEVAHHVAHASAVAGEFAVTEPMLCLTWDGTGFGQDGTIWGGETLLGRPGDWRRVASLRSFRLPGGDRATRECWRMALALCWETHRTPPVPDRPGMDLLREAWERGFQSPRCSAAGRLFDAASALLDVVQDSSYDGQGPIELEALARRAESTDGLPLPVTHDEDGIARLDWEPLLPMLLDAGEVPERRARRFHDALADGAARVAVDLAASNGVHHVGLAGGVFQNRLFSERVVTRLREAGLTALLPVHLPANDAAIAYGQLVEAAAQQEHR